MGQWYEEQRAALEQVKCELMDTGLFGAIEYLDGWCPIQAEGRLKNGCWLWWSRSREPDILKHQKLKLYFCVGYTNFRTRSTRK